MSVELLQGDCLELLKGIPTGSVDCVLCDPPFGTSSCKWDSVIPFNQLWAHFGRIIKPRCVIALFGCEPFSSVCRTSNLKNYKYDWIWDKHSKQGFLNAKKRPLKQYENIMIFSYGCPRYFPQMEQRGKPRIKGGSAVYKSGGSVYGEHRAQTTYNDTYYPADILRFSNAVRAGKVHPTQKPVPLLEYLIKTYTNPGETVLDCCMGSGSTGVAAANTGRKFIGIELDAQYFEIASRRIQAAQDAISSGGILQ